MIILSYKVYKHKNKINNKVYIGITGCTNLNERWKNGLGYKPYNKKSISHLYYAILKYGWDSFESTILEQGLTFEEACKKEQQYIKKFNSNHREYGYNKDSGGLAGRPLTSSAKLKISKANSGKNNGMYDIGENHPMYGKTHTLESRLKIREAHLGREPWNKGKVGIYSKEMRKKISETHKGNKYNLGKTHNKETKRIISEKTKQQWENDSFRQIVVNANLGNKNRGKRVICGNNAFDTIKDCAEYLGVHSKTVSRWLRGVYNIPSKFIHLNIRYEDTEVN